MRCLRRTGLSAALLSIIFSVPSSADTIDWDDPVSGDFDDDANWDGGVAPDDDDRARFDTGAASPYTVTLTQNEMLDGFEVGTDILVLDLNGFLLYDDASFESVRIAGNSDVADLTITGGGTFHTRDVLVGYGGAVSHGGMAVVDLVGPSTVWNHIGPGIPSFFLGDRGGDATLNILSGATLNASILRLGIPDGGAGNPAGTGTLNVVDGTVDVGTLTHEVGSLIFDGGQINVSESMTYTNTLQIDGATGSDNPTLHLEGISHTISELRIGGNDSTATNPGTVEIIGSAVDTGAGNTYLWNTGTLTIDDGGSLTTTALHGDGTIDLTDDGSLALTNDDVTIGGELPLLIGFTQNRFLSVSGQTEFAPGARFGISGGEFTTGTLLDNSGPGGGLTWSYGTFTRTASDHVFDAGELLSPFSHINLGKSLRALNGHDVLVGHAGTFSLWLDPTALIEADVLDIGAGGTFTLNGGDLIVNSIVNAGTFTWVSGSLGLGTLVIGDTDPSAELLGSNVTLVSGQILDVGSLVVGNDKGGTLNISSDQHAADSLVLGAMASGVGQVRVDGAQLDVAGQATVGDVDTGELMILNSASVTTGSLSIAASAGSSGDVTVNDSTLDVTGQLSASDGGDTLLTVENGAVVTAGSMFFGTGADTSSQLSIDDATLTVSGSTGSKIGGGDETIVELTGGAILNVNDRVDLYGAALSVNASTINFTNTSAELFVADDSSSINLNNAVMDIDPMTLRVDNDSIFSASVGSTITTGAAQIWDGSATVTGSGTTWDGGFVTVGDSGGVANLIVSQQAELTDEFTMRVGGTLGQSTGIVNIQTGGSVTANSAILADGGTTTGNNASADVDVITTLGTPSSLEVTNSLIVARHGVADLDVTGGSTLTTGSAVVGSGKTVSGSFFEGTGTVNIESTSTWTNAGALTVGQDGHGTLNVLSGGSVTTATFNSGTATNADDPTTAQTTVDGTDSLLHVTGNAYVGGDSGGAKSAATLSATGSGEVQVDGDLQVWDDGTLEVNGGSANVGGTLHLSGTLDLTASSIQADQLDIVSGGDITGFGTVDTPNDPAKPLVNNGNITGNSLAERITLTGYVKGVGTCDNCNITGTDAPGASTAAVNRGSVSYNGTLEIEVGGTFPGSGYDQLNHILGAGIASLGGDLIVDLIGGFPPDEVDVFTILTADGDLEGTLDNVGNGERLMTLDGEGSFLVEYDSASDTVVLSEFFEGILGDYNNDGAVNAADYTVWRNNKGLKITIPNDRTPGTVDLSDYLFWRDHYGEVYSGGAGTSAAVPEPAAPILALCGLVGLTMLRRRF